MMTAPIPTRSRRPRLRRTLAAVALLTGSGLASAETSPYYIGASLNLSHESNLLRLVDTQATPAGLSKSDTVTSTALLAGFDQPFGRQRASANLTVRDNRYSRNPQYDNQSYQGSAALDWSTVERFSGSLNASASRNLSALNLLDVGLVDKKNLESVQSLGASVRWGLASLYALEASIGQRQVDNSLDEPRIQARNFKQDTASFGLSWRPGGSTTVGLGLRSSRGTYPKFLQLQDGSFQADRLKRDDIELTGSMQVTGASNLSVKLSSGKTQYDLSSQRDFSGLTGALSWNWQATGKTIFNLRVTRDTGQESYAFQSIFNQLDTIDYSRVSTIVATRVDYAATAKISMNLGLTLMNRDIVRVLPGIFGDTRATGTERVTLLSLGATWRPTRSATVGCNLSSDSRSGGGTLGTDLKASSVGCFGQFVLQ